MNFIKSFKGRICEVELYEDKIIIKRSGFLSTLSQGFKGDKTIPISMITSVQFKKPGFFTTGYIQFGIQGGIESRGGLSAAVTDENSVIFTPKKLKDFMELKDYIENKISTKGTEKSSPKNQNIDELEKLHDLYNKRIITEEEFTAKKKQILGI